ncbi:MAG TPA: hypothetical protein VF812_00135 [Ktedonobacterales bacterium]
MSESKIARSPRRSRYGEMRRQAFPLWDGPGSIEMRELDGGRFYGWSVLSLAARFDYPVLLESRTVYGHLFDEEQAVAILRAVSWDDKEAHRAIREQGQSAPLVMPVRFVRIPLDQLRQWLAIFKDMAIIAEQTLVEDATVPIRRLRIEWEYTSCVVEKIWKAQGPQHAVLLAAWTQVWQEMGEALRAAPQLDMSEIEEIFDAMQPDTSVYNAQDYRPDWLALS